MATRRLSGSLVTWILCVPWAGIACGGTAPEPSSSRSPLAAPETSPQLEERHHGPGTEGPQGSDGAAHPGASPASTAHPSGHDEPGFAKDFSAVERFASHFDDPKRDAWQKPEEVLALLELRPGQTVADIGAGTGYFIAALARAVGAQGRVLALDTEPKMVDYLEQRAAEEGLSNVVARHVPPEDPELPPRSVDRILIVNTWHHISQRKSYASKLLQALRPGGAVLVVDYTQSSDMGPPQDHRLPPERVIEELAAAGLRATLVDESLPKQYVVRAENTEVVAR